MSIMLMSVQIYKLSQENHQVLRRCKGSVSANQLAPPPPSYVRPNGFKVMPAMLAQQLALQTPVRAFYTSYTRALKLH